MKARARPRSWPERALADDRPEGDGTVFMIATMRAPHEEDEMGKTKPKKPMKPKPYGGHA